ncbi:MAG: sigma-70 family RNA polymerase sigma factor [Candidatus Riflebacteria bacterium]|nr:sigma-70 family RNA polymerase sigma factor [Candidatus Riflebacteria bacterium]
MPSFTREHESDLIVQARKGRKEAFEPIVEKYWPQVHSVIRRSCRSQATCDDLCQETFLKAFNYLSQFDTNRPFAPWIMKIAVNTLSEHMRKETKNQETLNLDEGLLVKALGNISDNVVSRMTVDALLEKLPLSYRIVFLLRHGAQLSYEEISMILDEPAGTIKTNIFRAREMLRTWLFQNEAVNQSQGDQIA